MTSKEMIIDIQMFINEAYSDNEPLQENQIKSKQVFNDYCNIIKQDLDRLEELKKENQEAVKIVTLLKNKEGYIKSQKGKMMKLRISHITYNGTKFIVNGYCIYSDNCRCVPLNKVYLSEVLYNDK